MRKDFFRNDNSLIIHLIKQGQKFWVDSCNVSANPVASSTSGSSFCREHITTIIWVRQMAKFRVSIKKSFDFAGQKLLSSWKIWCLRTFFVVGWWWHYTRLNDNIYIMGRPIQKKKRKRCQMKCWYPPWSWYWYHCEGTQITLQRAAEIFVNATNNDFSSRCCLHVLFGDLQHKLMEVLKQEGKIPLPPTKEEGT